MTGAAAIRAILASDSAIVAQVNNRIFPDYLPEDCQMPAIALWTVTATPFDCLGGGQGMEKGRIRVESFANTRAKADELWLLCNKALVKDIKRGEFGGVQVIALSQGTGSHHLADRPYDGTDKWMYRTIQSFDISYNLYKD